MTTGGEGKAPSRHKAMQQTPTNKHAQPKERQKETNDKQHRREQTHQTERKTNENHKTQRGRERALRDKEAPQRNTRHRSAGDATTESNEKRRHPKPKTKMHGPGETSKLREPMKTNP